MRVAYDDTVRTLRLCEHAASRSPGQIDPPEFRARDIGNAVVTREPLVQERVPAVDEVEDAAVFADDVLDKELGLLPHRVPEVVLELRKAILVARHGLERAELQPLAAEVLGQCVRLRVAQHPSDLEVEHSRIAQRAGIRRPAELGVRHAGPDEVREPRRELVLADRLHERPGFDRAVALEAEEEIGRNEQRLNADGQPFLERTFLLLRQVDEFHVFLDFGCCDRSAEGAPCEIRHDLPRADRLMAAVEMAAGVNLREACASRARDLRIRPTDVHRPDPHAVERNLLQLRLRLLELLLQLRDPLGRGVGRRRERSDRFRFQ